MNMKKEGKISQTFRLWDSETKKVVEVEARGVSNGEWLATCPKHNDHKPSLSINPEKGVYHCFGCGWKGQLANGNSPSKKILSQNALSYLIENGHSYIPETIAYFHFSGSENGEKEYIWYNYQGVSRYIEVEESSKWKSRKGSKATLIGDLSQERILLCEGEHDMFMAFQKGLRGYATFTSGAQSLPDKKILSKLKDKEVVIIYDKDEAGGKGARRVAKSLSSIAKSIKIVKLPVKEGEDLTDYFNQGATKENLEDIINKTLTEGRKESKKSRFIKVEDYIKIESAKPKWLVEGLIPANSLVLLVGKPKLGKSLLSIELARTVAKGEKFLDTYPTVKGSVMLILVDDPPSLIRERFQPLGEEKLPIWIYDKMWDSDTFYTLEQEAWELQPSLIVIDTLVKAAPKIKDGENDASLMDRVIARFRKLVAETGVTVLFIHHTNKSGGVRGSSAIEGAVQETILAHKQGENIVLAIEWKYAPVEPIMVRLGPDGFSFLGNARECEKRLPKEKVIEALKRLGKPSTEKEIVSEAGIRREYCLEALHDLVDEGKLVLKKEERKGKRGPGTQLYSLSETNPQNKTCSQEGLNTGNEFSETKPASILHSSSPQKTCSQIPSIGVNNENELIALPPPPKAVETNLFPEKLDAIQVIKKVFPDAEVVEDEDEARMDG